MMSAFAISVRLISRPPVTRRLSIVIRRKRHRRFGEAPVLAADWISLYFS
jgi:hypothetical protein